MLRTWLLRRAFLTKGRCLSRSLFCRICFSPWNRSGMARLPRLIPLLALLELWLPSAVPLEACFVWLGLRRDWLLLCVPLFPWLRLRLLARLLALVRLLPRLRLRVLLRARLFPRLRARLRPRLLPWLLLRLRGRLLPLLRLRVRLGCLSVVRSPLLFLSPGSSLASSIRETLLPFSFIETHANGFRVNSFINTHSFENNKCYLRIKSASSNDF